MRYLGNKTKLLGFIDEVIEKHNIEGETFSDLFAGTCSVGDYFKDRFTIHANDFLYYSYVFSRAKIMNSDIPEFEIFSNKYESDIFEWLNNLEFEVRDDFFVYNNYTPEGDRMFFTRENALKIDGIRITIEDIYNNNEITENEYYFLLASLLESVTKVSNTSGTYEAFFKFWESRAEKDFKIKPLEMNSCTLFSQQNRVTRKDTNVLLKEIEGDIAYIDTPYTVTQYISAYHMLETIAKYDYPKIKGVGGKRGRGDKNSMYSRKNEAIEEFEDLLRQINYKHILISYSNQALIPLDDLVELIELFAIDGEVHIEDLYYSEYKNHRSSKKRKGKKLKEVIIYFKKDMSIHKSPLNYSGSKDKLLEPILKELPKKVEVFADVMGGAFNVGSNVVATDKVVYNEINPFIYEIIEMLLTEDSETLIQQIEDRINEFELEKKSKEEYYSFREQYNNNNSELDLFILHMYSFQNMIRFNNSHEFNTPIGVSGYSEGLKERIENFNVKAPRVELHNKDFLEFNWEEFPVNTVFYFDPPYFITSANYNDGKRGMKGWNADHESEMINVLSKLDRLGYKFILSNVLYHRGRENHLLLEFIEEHDVQVINIGTSGRRYQKEEVIIKNF